MWVPIREAYRTLMPRDVTMLAEAIVGSLRPEGLENGTQARLLEGAIHHGVLGLFALPHPAAQHALLATRARNVRALRFTHRVVAAIEGASVPVVVMKGAAASCRWNEPTVRQQSDVDVLVHRDRKDDVAR